MQQLSRCEEIEIPSRKDQRPRGTDQILGQRQRQVLPKRVPRNQGPKLYPGQGGREG